MSVTSCRAARPVPALLPLLAVLLAGFLVAPPAGSAAGTAARQAAAAGTAVAPDPTAACARPALAPSLRLRKSRVSQVTEGGSAESREAAGQVFRAVELGRKLERPARAQALAAAAVMSGDVAGERPLRDFYQRLGGTDGWKTLPPSIAIHRVLGTPDPFAHEEAWDRVVALLGSLSGSADEVARLVSAGAQVPKRCRTGAVDQRGLPLPAGTGYRILRSRPALKESTKADRAKGKAWFVASCGTPVLSATPGTVRVLGGDKSGSWRIEVTKQGKQEQTGVTIRYAHVQGVTVEDGASVVAGQPIASVGDLGGVDRCALGLALDRRGGEAGKPLDPVAWLGKAVRPKPEKSGGDDDEEASTVEDATTTIASYNVLGAKHTGRDGPGRMARGMGRLNQMGVQAAAMQEVDPPMAGVIKNTPNWDVVTAAGDVTAVAWRTDVWSLEGSETVHTPRRSSITAILSHRASGNTLRLMSVHNVVGLGKARNGMRIRAEGIERARVRSYPGPVVVAGDFNTSNRKQGRTPNMAPLIGAHDGRMANPAGHYGPVDYMFHNHLVQKHSFNMHSGLPFTDHPILTARMTLEAE